jgi:hypothetical protein
MSKSVSLTLEYSPFEKTSGDNQDVVASPYGLAISGVLFTLQVNVDKDISDSSVRMTRLY